MNKLSPSAIAIILIVVLGGGYGLSGFNGVEPGEVLLKVKQFGENKGMQKETLGAGTHWIDPIQYDTPNYDARFKQYSLVGSNAVGASTKDGQPVIMDVSIEMGLLAAKVPWIHENIGKEFWKQVIYPALRAAIRSETPSEESEHIYTAEGRDRIQVRIQKVMDDKFKEHGFLITVNLRDIEFTDAVFKATLVAKATAAQQVIIDERKAESAVNKAKAVENKAEGEKQKVIKEAEADAEKLKQEGIGLRAKKEENAKGILAVQRAQAEGVRLKSLGYAGKGGKYLAQVEIAQTLGPKFQIWGVPTGAPGTSSIMDMNGMLKGAFAPVAPAP